MAFSTHKNLLLPLSFFVFLLFCSKARGQEVTIHGTVFNMYRTKPLDGVSVMSTMGRGTATDSNGNYAITVSIKDSLYFSYLGRETAKFPISNINSLNGFDIALHVDPVTLKEVKVMPRNYHYDSLQNRQDYAKIFNYKKPGFKLNSTTGQDGGGVGVDLNQLIEMFDRAKTRRTLAFQRRLEDEEREKYVDYRFNRSTVLKITHLEGDELDSFMARYRPSYDFCHRATDYDLLDYIKLAFHEYQADRKDHP
ncbi:carboxypeptidase-like regulatory domain-containing protein [Puia dinghuensis]|uniref:Carboxypeptidase-like regulatory domain-containing protein n=1 Tax=Puia dinghuensis TaxID=1792502 RepID=A0A8J2XU82_9BACT|nr:carboxypeptidase-like regulatory domain-containing protein [Puia dinghuensis]GGB10239.1 hypothetical protein GCM10011511_37250 [Puia dinghuensis]